MASKIRFHLDESVAVAVAQGLRRRGVEVTTTSEAGLTSADDESQLAFALRERRVLVTQDADFIRLHQRACNMPALPISIRGCGLSVN